MKVKICTTVERELDIPISMFVRDGDGEWGLTESAYKLLMGDKSILLRPELGEKEVYNMEAIDPVTVADW